MKKGKGKEDPSFQPPPPSLFKLNGYPLTESLPCNSTHAGTQAPNVTTIFLPSRPTPDARTLQDILDFERRAGLLLLDLCLKSLDHFSGTRHWMTSFTPEIPDREGHCVDKLNPETGKMGQLYTGKYYVSSKEVVPQCRVFVELLFHQGAFTGDHQQKISQAVKELAPARPLSADPLREESDPGNPLLIPAHLTSDKISGILVHFVSPDPKFSLLECISNQVVANAGRPTSTWHAKAPSQWSPPNSDRDITSIRSLVNLLFAYRNELKLKGISVPNSDLLKRLTLEALPSFPLNQDELGGVLKSRCINEAQCLRRAVADSLDGKYCFHLPLPPLAFEPESTESLLTTALPTYVVNDLFPRLNPRLPRIYANMYRMNEVLPVAEQLGMPAEYLAETEISPSQLQPFEMTALACRDPLRKEKNGAQATLLRSEAIWDLFQRRHDPNKASKPVLQLLLHYDKATKKGLSMNSVQPVFLGQDAVGNMLFERMRRLNTLLADPGAGVPVHQLLCAAQSLLVKPFTRNSSGFAPLHTLLLSGESQGKQVLEAVRSLLVPGTCEDFSGFSSSPWKNKSLVDDFCVHLGHITASFLVGKETKNKVTEKEISAWNSLCVSGQYDHNGTKVVHRFVLLGTWSRPIDHSSQIASLYTIKALQHGERAGFATSEPRDESQDEAIRRLFHDEHARCTVIHLAIQAGILHPPDLSLVNLLLERLEKGHAIFSRFDELWNAKVRTLYVHLVVLGADHLLHHNPVSPLITWDKGGVDAESGPLKAQVRLIEIKDLLLVQPYLGPSMTAAFHAISSFALDPILALHSALVKFMVGEGYDPDGIRQWVRHLDQKRAAYSKIDQKVREALTPMQREPYSKRKQDHPTTTLVFSSFHHQQTDLDEQGALPQDPDHIDPAYRRALEEGVDSQAQGHSIWLVSKEVRWNVRVGADCNQYGDGVVAIDSIMAYESGSKVKLSDILSHLELPPKGVPQPQFNSKIANTQSQLETLHHLFVQQRQWQQEQQRQRQLQGQDLFNRQRVDADPQVPPVLPFPIFENAIGEVFVEVDKVTIILEGNEDADEALCEIFGRDASSKFLSTLALGGRVKLPMIPPVPAWLTPRTMEDLAAYLHPDFLETCEKQEVPILEEIPSPPPSKKAPGKKPLKFFKLSYLFVMQTPEAIAEAFGKILTSKHTKERKNIPSMCCHPRSPETCLITTIGKGDAESIARVMDEEEFFQREYNKNIGLGDMSNWQQNVAMEMNRKVNIFQRDFGKGAVTVLPVPRPRPRPRKTKEVAAVQEETTEVRDYTQSIGSPDAAVCDSEGNVVVAKSNQQLEWYDLRGNFLKSLDLGEWTPSGVAINENGRFAISLHTHEKGQLQNPRGIAVDLQGRFVVADAGNHGVHIFDAQGELVFKFGSKGSEPGQFSSPHGVALLSNEDIVVSDSDNNRIQVFDSHGHFIQVIGADRDNNRIVVYRPDGERVSVIGEGQISKPTGICVGPNQEIVVTENDRGRISIF